MYKQSRSEGFGNEVKRRIMLGTFALSSGYYDAYYKKAQQVRTLIKQDFESVFENYDVIIGPTTPTPSFKIGEKTDDPLTMYANDILNNPSKPLLEYLVFLCLAAYQMDLPLGYKLSGKHFDESIIYRVAHAFEQATEHHQSETSTVRSEIKMNFETIIGLEVHVELKTKSKIFSASPNAFGAAPNANTSVIDLGYPGVLPVLNKEAVDFAMKAALALNCEIATDTKFDRKNYFYPDNPKAYQISQFDKPIGENGWIEVEVKGETKRIRINRLHLEKKMLVS